MTIIDHTKPAAPKFLYSKWKKTCPDLLTCSTLEADRYYEREKERWHTGYGGLTNYHYFQLTQTKMKNADGEEIRPFWRDLDEERFFIPYDKAIKLANDLMVVKRRECGFSSVFWGVIPLVNSIIYPGSTNLLTSADKDRIKEGFLNKTCVAYDSLDEEIRPANASSRKEGYLLFAKQDPKTKKYSGLKSTIVCKDTVDNPNSFETYRAKSVLLDEFFLHPKAPQVRTSAQSCVKSGFKKVAPIVLGGSCGVTSKTGAVLGQQMWHDATALGIITIFIEGWMGISQADEYDDNGVATGKVLNFCVNGHSDQKAATEWIEKRRELLYKANDKNPYDTFVKEYPLSIEEIFKSQNTSRWEEETLEVINLQKREILKADVPCPRYSFTILNKSVTAEPSQKGSFYMLEPPKPNCKYIIGIDGTATGTESGETDGSNMASVVVKVMDPAGDPYMPVNIYSERPRTVEAGYRKILSQIIYYDQFGGLDVIAPESNAATIDHLSTFLEKEGYFRKIMRRKDLSGKGWTDTKKLGQYRTPEVIDFQYRQANIFIRKYAHSIQMLPLIDDMLLPISANADILDAWLMFFIAVPTFDTEKKKKIFVPKTRLTVVNVGGKTVWKEIPV